MIKKRVLPLLLAVAILAGCGTSSTSTPSSSQPTASTSSQTSTADEPPVTMEWLLGSNNVTVDDNGEIVLYIEDKFNIDLKAWELDSNKYNEQLAARIAGGEMPDVIRLSDMSIVAQFIEGGVIPELPIEMIKEKAPTYYEAVKKYDDGSFWTQLVYEGKNYGVAQPMAVNPFAVYWRQDWLDAVGKEVPTTLEEYEDVLTAFVNDDPDGNGVADTAGIAERSFANVFGAFGLRIVTGGNTGLKIEELQLGDDNVPFFPSIRPEAKDALEVLARWYEMGILDKEFITGENHGGYIWLSHSFMNGRIGSTSAQVSHYFSGPDFSDPDNHAVCAQEFFAINPNAEITIGPAMVGPDGHSGTEAWAKYGALTFLTAKAWEDPRKVDAFFEMLEASYSDPNYEYALMVGYGIEDKHWEMTDRGPIRLVDGDEARKAGIMNVNFGSFMDLELATKGPTLEFQKEMAPHGYYRYNAPATPEYTSTISTLDSLTEQAYFDIITGQKPLDYFDTYVEEFIAAGGLEVEKSIQDEYAARLAAVG